MQLTNNYYREVGFWNSINPDVFRDRGFDRVSPGRFEFAVPFQPCERAQSRNRGIPHPRECVPEHAVQDGGRVVLQSVSFLFENDGGFSGRSVHREYCFDLCYEWPTRTSFCPIWSSSGPDIIWNRSRRSFGTPFWRWKRKTSSNSFPPFWLATIPCPFPRIGTRLQPRNCSPWRMVACTWPWRTIIPPRYPNWNTIDPIVGEGIVERVPFLVLNERRWCD